MGSRERKRAERQKRKRRAVERAEVAPASEAVGEEAIPTGNAPVGEAPAGEATPVGEESFQERMSSRSEARNAEVRAGLEPLAEGERPTAVTVGAWVTVVLALIFTVSAIVAALGSVEIRGEEPQPFPLVVFGAVLWLMAWGMWKARYWAVLGFQMLLVLFILSAGLGLVNVSTVFQALGSILLLAGSGALFYFMIRAMARIQMPEKPGADPPIR